MNVIEIQDRDIFVMGDIHGEFHIAYARDGIKHACITLAGITPAKRPKTSVRTRANEITFFFIFFSFAKKLL